MAMPIIKKIYEKIKTIIITIPETNLNNYKENGIYFFSTGVSPINIPDGSNGWLHVMNASNEYVKQIWYRLGTNDINDSQIFIRTYNAGNWSKWSQIKIENI